MESFSSQVKEYLAERCLEELGIGEKNKVKWKECCGKAFLRAVFLFLAKEEKEGCVLTSTREAFLEIIEYALIRIFDTEAVVSRKEGEKKVKLILPTGARARFLKRTTLATDGCDRCLLLFVRAAFLSCGTVLDPRKGYHASFRTEEVEYAEELYEHLLAFGVEAKTTLDEKGFLVYLKDSTKIEDLLSLMGAQRFSLELMNSKIEKSIRGDINRRQNFDGANMRKSINGAMHVIESIRFLEKTGVLATLSEPLQKAAKLRLSLPEVSLAELCHRSEEEITKSGLNHRLQKLCSLAEKLKKEEEQ